MVHGREGFAFFKRAFMREKLGEDRPIYLFQVPGLDGRTKPLESIEEIAGVYVASSRKIQPSGPYHILAMCAGAFIALEMCNQIEEAGETVGRLILLDPRPVPGALAKLHQKKGKSRMKRALSRFKRRRIRAEELRCRIQRGRAGDIDWASPEERSYSPEAMLEASVQLFRAFDRYVPRPYSGKAALLVSAERAPKIVGYGSFWRTYLGGIDYEVCGSTHDDIFGAQIVETGRFVRNVLETTRADQIVARSQALCGMKAIIHVSVD